MKSLSSLIICGVHQGSNIDPLLFSIFITDFNQCSKLIEFSQTLCAKCKTLWCLTSKFNQELQEVVARIRMYRIYLRNCKSSVRSLRNVLKQVFFINCHYWTLPVHKILRILVDSKLISASHVRNVCTKTRGATCICNILIIILLFHVS